MTQTTEVSWMDFSMKHFKGKEIFNRKTGDVLLRWQAFPLIKHCWQQVLNGEHLTYGWREKEQYVNGEFEGQYVKQVKRRGNEYRDKKNVRINSNDTQDTTTKESE